MMSIYLQAILIWLLYTVITKYLFFGSFFWGSSFATYLPVAFVSAIFGVIFLYFFSHDDFFKFAKMVEKKEKKSERKWIHVFIHSGRVLGVFLITIAAGPLVGALSARFLLRKNSHRYLILFLSCVIGAIAWLAIYKGGFWFAWDRYLNVRK